MTTGFDLDEIERLLAAATPGEWAIGIRDGKRAIAGYVGEWIAILPHGHRDGFGCTSDNELLANRSLIVALHNSAPAILTEIRELRAENARLREVVKHYGDTLCEGIGECVGDFCGNLSSDECGGCFARAALGEPQ